MKRYIYRFFALLTTVLGAWTFTGCADDVDTYMTEESGCFNLVVTVPDESATRATDAELGFNEFKVTKLHLYFYNDAAGASVYEYVWTGEINNNENNTLTVPLPADALLEGGLFGTTGTECIVYAVANVDEDTLPDGPQTIAGLKALGITSTFEQTITQPSFAMDGKSKVNMNRTARRASGEITLERAAAKITLAIDVPAEIEVTDAAGNKIKYSSNTGSMHVWIGNGVKNSKLNTAPVTAGAADLYSNAMETTEGKGSGSGFTKNDAIDKFVQKMPFYSYPNKWEPTSPDGNCYLTLVLPWTYTDAENNTQQITTYYRIPVQLKECKIERNMHYDIRVTIGRLGSTDPQEPIDVDVEWNYAIPWNTHGLSTDIKQVRYLLLNNNNFNDALGAYTFDMDNTTEISIPVGTSHEVEIASVTMKWRDYYNNADRTRTLSSSTSNSYNYSNIASYNAARNYAGIEFDSSTSMLKFTRDLRHIAWSNSRPSISTNEAFCSYTFDIVLRHKDQPTQTATVRITQYPPIYITAEETEAANYRFVNGYSSNTQRSNTTGYVSFDDNRINNLYLGSIEEKSNHYTYILTISRFESKNDYVIADPRSRSINNELLTDDSSTEAASWSRSFAPKGGGSSRKLRYYYPADPSDSKINYIAPKLRIASQYGITQPVNEIGAKRRCASYQENGRPAGRWRLPTQAEIKYIATLSCEKYIPYLFGSANTNADYWCASGAINVDNSSNPPKVETASGTSHYVRCVYDEWYWGNDVLADKTKFTWGDKQRTTSGNE